MKQKWELDAESIEEYHAVACQRGREFILRLNTGADVCLAIQKFAKDHDIRFAKIHAAVMGGLQPVRYSMWVPDVRNPENWFCESIATVHNLSMILALSGIIHPRVGKDGKEESFPAIHFVTGGGWDVPTCGGHMNEGTLVKGNLEVFITEITGIDVLYPEDADEQEAPMNWYEELE